MKPITYAEAIAGLERDLGAKWEVARRMLGGPPPRVVVDVGAHWGYYSLAAAAAGAEVVVALEPHSLNYVKLFENVLARGVLGRIAPLPFAVVGNDDGLVHFAELRQAIYQGRATTTCFGLRYGKDTADAITVPAGTAPTIAFRALLKGVLGWAGQIDVLKIDVEGSEYDLFAGLDQDEELQGLLRSVAYLDLELHQPEDLAGVPAGADIELRFALARHGFDLGARDVEERAVFQRARREVVRWAR